jgi:hypothetical protein
MKRADYSGARGSLAGTSFHELWALSQAMKLLDMSSGISAIAVEGLGQEVRASGDITEFDGVDCSLYYGSANPAAADRVEIIQLKYSGSRPGEKWTLSKLAKSSKKKGNNSVLRRLATAYAGVCEIAKNAVPGVRLVSNQAVSNDVIEGFRRLGHGQPSGSEFRAKVLKATSLGAKELKAFAGSLDLTSHTGSRFQLEAELLLEISRWTDDDARTALEVLLTFIRKQMLPENARRLLLREHVILMIGGSSSPDSLFPCPSDLVLPKTPVIRSAAKDLAAKLTGGTKQVCLHGSPGCGKTTVLQQVHRFLPENSKIIIFDSYGAGRYLDAARLRHRPQDAFVQLCNEIAVAMSLPLFLTRSDRVDARSFVRRLQVASETLHGMHPEALLVITVDAADNSLTAAKRFGERSFVEDLISIGELPSNTRVLLSCRSARLADLRLPDHFAPFPLGGFDLAETSEYVRATIPLAPPPWIDDFHSLSGGVPRVQRYAIENGMHLTAGPLSLLLPSGKTLNVIFETIFADALRKFGIPDEFETFCAALVALPRPIPIDYCARVSAISRDIVADLCADLAPGLRNEGGSVAFADEDIEEFVRQKAVPRLDEMLNSAADVLWVDREKSEYSAAHVARLLFDVGRKSELINLIETEEEPSAVIDPLRRREVRLERIKLGVRLANEKKDLPAALRVLLRGAEAVKTDDAISGLLNSNLDLAAAFAEDSIIRRVLLDKTRIELHGPLIAQLMLRRALNRQPTLVRSYARQFRAWLDRRELAASLKQYDSQSDREKRWDISPEDIAATVEAIFLNEGFSAGLQSLLRWKPRVIRLRVAESFVPRLLARGRADLVSPVLADHTVPTLFKAWIAVPLARGGNEIGDGVFRQILEDPRLPRLLKVKRLSLGYQNEIQYEFLDKFMYSCELSAKTLADEPFFKVVLGRLGAGELRRTALLFSHDTELLNILVRAYCLSCSIDQHKPEVSDFLAGENQKDAVADEYERRRQESLRTMVSTLIGFLSARADTFLSGQLTETSMVQLRDAVRTIRGDEYHLDVMVRGRLFEMLSLNLFDLCGLFSADPLAILHLAASVFGEKISPTGHQLLPLFRRASTNAKTHGAVVKWISDRDKGVTTLQTTASEKSDAFIALSRLVMPISESDARVVFSHAHEATEEIDADARFQLKALGTLLERAVPSLSEEERKRLACAAASTVTSAAIRIGNEDGFPWNNVVTAITTAHPGTAFAAIAQWEDRSLASSSDTLEAALEAFGASSLSTIALQLAMNPLLESGRLLRSASNATADQMLSDALLDDLCRDTLQFGSQEDKIQCSHALEAIQQPSVWLAHLRMTAGLIASLRDSEKSVSEKGSHDSIEPRVELPLSKFQSPEAILEAVRKAKKPGTYIPDLAVLIAIGKEIIPADRVSHLDAVLRLCELGVRGDDIVGVFEVANHEWSSPAVSLWMEEAVPLILRTRLPAFVGFVEWDGKHATVDRLLRLTKEPDRSIRALIEGLGRDIEAFDAGTIYELCRRLFRMVGPEDARAVLNPYLERLRLALPPEDKASFDESDIPDSPDDVLARYLFVLMSDVDTRIRWRAAHCLRRFVRYGQNSLVPAIVGLWRLETERTFRAPDTPFYWHAARLWLTVSLSRIAVDHPQSIVPAAGSLLDAIRDEAYPHPAVRSFCQDTLRSLQESGVISLSGSDQSLVETANQTSLPRTKQNWRNGLNRNRHSSSRQWNFDSLDTIPYWIDPTSSIFAKVSSDDLANEAEKWIIDRWKVNVSFDKWSAEPRRSRFSERDYGLHSNDHGSQPTIEDYRTYLAWYALQCAVGSLMRTEALSQTEYEDGEDEFEERLGRQKLTESPYWLADLLSTRPPESRFWKKPADINKWLTEISEQDFLAEVSRGESGEDLIIFGRNDVHSSEFTWDSRIESALVEPSNALALVRALQTVDEPLDFKLPEAGPERYGQRFAISESGFVLEGWVTSHDSDGRFDEGDPLCFGTSRTRFTPFEQCGKPTLASDGILSWPRIQGISFSYERWKDRRDLSDRDYEGSEIRTFGSRLYGNANEIFSFLEAQNRELIMEIWVSRKRGGIRYQSRKKEESVGVLEGRFVGIFLLRADKSVYTAEGCIGTWPFLGVGGPRNAQ